MNNLPCRILVGGSCSGVVSPGTRTESVMMLNMHAPVNGVLPININLTDVDNNDDDDEYYAEEGRDGTTTRRGWVQVNNK